jgi:hypothetical protein
MGDRVDWGSTDADTPRPSEDALDLGGFTLDWGDDALVPALPGPIAGSDGTQVEWATPTHDKPGEVAGGSRTDERQARREQADRLRARRDEAARAKAAAAEARRQAEIKAEAARLEAARVAAEKAAAQREAKRAA